MSSTPRKKSSHRLNVCIHTLPKIKIACSVVAKNKNCVCSVVSKNKKLRVYYPTHKGGDALAVPRGWISPLPPSKLSQSRLNQSHMPRSTSGSLYVLGNIAKYVRIWHYRQANGVYVLVDIWRIICMRVYQIPSQTLSNGHYAPCLYYWYFHTVLSLQHYCITTAKHYQKHDKSLLLSVREQYQKTYRPPNAPPEPRHT